MVSLKILQCRIRRIDILCLEIVNGQPLLFFLRSLCFLLSMWSWITMQLAVRAVVIVNWKVSSSSLSYSMSSSFIANEKTSTINEFVSNLQKTMGLVVREMVNRENNHIFYNQTQSGLTGNTTCCCGSTDMNEKPSTINEIVSRMRK